MPSKSKTFKIARIKQICKGLVFLVVVLFGFLILQSNVLAIINVGKFKTHELIFTAQNSPKNPFDTYSLRLEITDPTGLTFEIDGFFDGNGAGDQAGNIWKARICPYMTGTWSWRTVEGDAPDVKLAGLSGQFECTERNDLGGVTTDGQFFRFQNGEYIYLQGNFLDFTNGLRTTHTFMSETTTDAQRDAIISRHRDFHQANKANIYFANKGDYGSQSVTPWLGSASSNDKETLSLARWKLYDEYIARFKENEMLAEMWFFADDSGFGSLAAADRNRLFRYAMARISAFSHTLFVIALEWGEGWSQSEVEEAGRFIQNYNPWRRPLSVHSLTGADWPFSGQSWATFIATQGGNSASNAQVNQVAVEYRNNESIPHIDEEYGVLQSDSNSRLRGNMWANFCGGAAGGGTGSDLKSFINFIAQSRVPFQRMRPANGLVSNGGNLRFCLSEPGHHYVIYSSSDSFTVDLQGDGLTAYWYNPRDPNAALQSGTTVNSGVQSFTPPDNNDWVLWITDRTNLNQGVTHPSSGAALTSETIPSSGNEDDQLPPEPPTGFKILEESL